MLPKNERDAKAALPMAGPTTSGRRIHPVAAYLPFSRLSRIHGIVGNGYSRSSGKVLERSRVARRKMELELELEPRASLLRHVSVNDHPSIARLSGQRHRQRGSGLGQEGERQMVRRDNVGFRRRVTVTIAPLMEPPLPKVRLALSDNPCSRDWSRVGDLAWCCSCAGRDGAGP